MTKKFVNLEQFELKCHNMLQNIENEEYETRKRIHDTISGDNTELELDLIYLKAKKVAILQLLNMATGMAELKS